MDEALRRIVRRAWSRLRRWGRHPAPAASARVVDMDRRLDLIERDQREIAARLRLLELQADPRGWRHDREQ